MDSPGKIMKLSGTHCARGSQRCPKCVEAAKNISLVLVVPDSYQGETQQCRQVMGFKDSKGNTYHTPFRIAVTFETENEAIAYGQEHKITDIDLEGTG